jgi:hypothetical protein
MTRGEDWVPSESSLGTCEYWWSRRVVGESA